MTSTTMAGPIFMLQLIRSRAFYSRVINATSTDIAVTAGCAYNVEGHKQAGMGVAVADCDCDGWSDIFQTNFVDDTCNHNNGDGTFTDFTFPSGVGVNNHYVAWECGFIDYDNDGWQDILQVNGHVCPEVDQYDFGESFKTPDWYTEILAMVHSKMYLRRWAQASRSDSPVGVPRSGTITTTAAWTPWC
jgi:hypothetical protein